MFTRIVVTLFFICSFLSLEAQFKLLGDARHMDGSCIQLTPDVDYSEGIAYSTSQIDLRNYFEIEFDIYLGDKDAGADGIAFVIHNDPRKYEAFGTYGECLGYGRWSPYYDAGSYIAPSIAIEFDTYQNIQQNDPSSDHVAYLENGVNQHLNFWNNKDDEFNLEDDGMHNFRFRWNPNNRQITVFLDNKKVFQGNRNLIDDIFLGETKVIWGFTASTGRAHNLQYFCFRRLAFKSIQNNPEVKKFARAVE